MFPPPAEELIPLSRAEFLAAVRTASGGNPAVLKHAVAFANQIDLANLRRLAPISYAYAVVIDGTHRVVVCGQRTYARDRVPFEAAAGEVTAVLRGADLLAGHIGDQPTTPKEPTR